MPLLINIVLCLGAAAVIAGGVAAVVLVVAQTEPPRVTARQKAPIAKSRVQAWLDGKTEELAYSEKTRAVASIEGERAEPLLLEVSSPIEQAAERADAPRVEVPSPIGQATERAEALRVEAPSPIEQAAVPPARVAEEIQVMGRERARRAKQGAKQETRRRFRLRQAEYRRGYSYQRAYSHAAKRRWSSYSQKFLTRRDRYGY
jgi:hypothetical protein